jgi:hypothetical protein
VGSYWLSLSFWASRQWEAVRLRHNILIIDATVTVITDEIVTEIVTEIATATVMIAIAETIVTMTGMGITTPIKSPDSKATATASQQERRMPNVVRATIRSGHTSGGMVTTATTRVMEIEVSTSRSFVTPLSKATVKVTPVTVGTIAEATMDDTEMAAGGRSN